MRILTLLFLFSLASFSTSLKVSGQASDRLPFVLAAKKPELAVSIEGSASLKIVNRKSSYVSGEMFSIDAAIRIGHGPYYYPPLDALTLSIQGRNGSEIKLKRFLIVDGYFIPCYSTKATWNFIP